MELINFLVAPLSVQVVGFSPPHVAPPLDRDDAMSRHGQLLLLLYALHFSPFHGSIYHLLPSPYFSPPPPFLPFRQSSHSVNEMSGA